MSRDTSHNSPKANSAHKCEAGDIFESTTAYYARYRPDYPTKVINWIVDTFGLDGTGALLDVGCGTGRVCFPLSPYFQSVTAIDPSREMLIHCKKAAKTRQVNNATFIEMAAESISSDLGPFRLATFGASYHWTDRIKVAELVYDALEKNGSMVVLAPSSTWSGEEKEWKNTVRNTIKKWLGEERKAGKSGTYKSTGTFEEALGQTRFRHINTNNFSEEHVWTLDSLIGYLYSTSFASKAVLGDKVAAFETDLRETLLSLEPSGEYPESIEVTVVSALK